MAERRKGGTRRRVRVPARRAPREGNRRQPARSARGHAADDAPACAAAAPAEPRAAGPRAAHAAQAARRRRRGLRDQGYHAARVDDVVKLAQTSHGTFYLYFANKEDLFRALVAEVADQMQALAEELGPLTPGAKGRAELQAWIGGFADLYERYGAVIRAWTEAEIGAHEFGRMGNDVMIRFTSVLTERIAAAAPKDLDPVIAALALVAMLERLNYYVLSRQVRITKPQMVDTLARVTHAALFGN